MGMTGMFSRLWIGLAALPLLLLVVGALLITSGPTESGADTGIGTGTYTPLSNAPWFATSELAPEPAFVTAIPSGPGALTALLVQPATMRSRPNGPKIGSLGLRSQFGSQVVMLVARREGSWLGVVSPVAGNGRLGWIPQADTILNRIDYRLAVSLSQRQLTVFHGGDVVERYTIAVGKPTAPTPTGRFAITDRLDTGDPTGPYGCCILATSALAPHAIQDWSGGNRIAIHSTPETSSIGLPVSHGCMRLTVPEGQWLLDHIPLGTPLVIRE
jgi:lipoprotein-anchoring transpeptidase ErfK/SrfK